MIIEDGLYILRSCSVDSALCTRLPRTIMRAMKHGQCSHDCHHCTDVISFYCILFGITTCWLKFLIQYCIDIIDVSVRLSREQRKPCRCLSAVTHVQVGVVTLIYAGEQSHVTARWAGLARGLEVVRDIKIAFMEASVSKQFVSSRLVCSSGTSIMSSPDLQPLPAAAFTPIGGHPPTPAALQEMLARNKFLEGTWQS